MARTCGSPGSSCPSCSGCFGRGAPERRRSTSASEAGQVPGCSQATDRVPCSAGHARRALLPASTSGRSSASRCRRCGELVAGLGHSGASRPYLQSGTGVSGRAEGGRTDLGGSLAHGYRGSDRARGARRRAHSAGASAEVRRGESLNTVDDPTNVVVAFLAEAVGPRTRSRRRRSFASDLPDELTTSSAARSASACPRSGRARSLWTLLTKRRLPHDSDGAELADRDGASGSHVVVELREAPGEAGHPGKPIAGRAFSRASGS